MFSAVHSSLWFLRSPAYYSIRCLVHYLQIEPYWFTTSLPYNAASAAARAAAPLRSKASNGSSNGLELRKKNRLLRCTQGLIEILGFMVIFDENQGVSDLSKYEFLCPIYVKIIKFLVI